MTATRGYLELVRARLGDEAAERVSYALSRMYGASVTVLLCTVDPGAWPANETAGEVLNWANRRVDIEVGGRNMAALSRWLQDHRAQICVRTSELLEA